MSSYVPKTPPVFDSDKQLTLYTYDDDNVIHTQNFKFGLIFSLIVQPPAYSYYYYSILYPVYESWGALTLGLIGTLVMLAMPLGARSTVLSIHLQNSGQDVHICTATATGVGVTQLVKRKPLVVPIHEIKANKITEGYQLMWRNRYLMLYETGRILQPELLFAVLRGLAVQPGPRN